MKKIILSMTLIGLLGGSVANASDTQSLTRATVKLIKSNSEVQSSLNNIYKTLDKHAEIDSSLQSQINSNDSDISALNTFTENNNNVISSNSNNIQTLTDRFQSVSEKADKALLTSEDTRRILSEISLVSAKVETQSKEAKSSNEKIASKANKLEESMTERASNLENALEEKSDSLKTSIESKTEKLGSDISVNNEKLIVLEKMINLNSKKILEDKVNISKLEVAISDTNKEIGHDKDINLGRYNELKESIKSMKIFYEAEINLLKAKLDRAKPIVLEPIKVTNCVSGNCSNKLSVDEENILTEYLKK